MLGRCGGLICATALLAFAGAGCGDDDAKPPAQPRATVAPPTATAEPTRTPDATRAPTASPSPTPSRRRRNRPGSRFPAATPLGGAVPRYLAMISAHDVPGLCREFRRATGTVTAACSRQRSRRDRRAPKGEGEQREPAIARVALTARPRVRIRGTRARAAIKVAVFDEAGRQTMHDETVYLRRRGGTWLVAAPTPLFQRILGDRSGE